MAPARHFVARLTPPERGSRVRAVLALIAAGLALAVATPVAAAAAPPPVAGLQAAPGTDDEGGTDALRKQLDEASRGFLDAKAKLDASTKRQQELASRLGTIETELTTRSQTVGELADTAYRTGRLGPVTALLNSDGPDGLMDRAARLEAVAANEDRQLRALVESRNAETEAKAAVDREIAEQRAQLTVMTKRKQQAERALAVAGSSARSTGGSGGTSSASAKPAPRNSDGSWPSESCSVNDPTTSGCITPRTLHAMNQAKAAGFTRFVSCFRSGGSGEHPKGRACDFAAQKGGFGGVATGGDRTYGNNLAAYFVKNANRLGVLYVIWFKEIWLPSSGWKSYSGAGGDPSSDHTNHVHLSMN
ncbi:coiled-coil domain-containing protein [Plantactinospora sp. GCM10030261]|uniref:coiled-coil domain-containing protein n=1 Tax=Plantactinospora sp. GCM10030261 TaxID=3273420 RepID=UPI00361386D9